MKHLDPSTFEHLLILQHYLATTMLERHDVGKGLENTYEQD